MVQIPSTTIKISKGLFEDLKVIQERLTIERKRRVTHTEVIQELLMAYERERKPRRKFIGDATDFEIIKKEKYDKKWE